MKKGSLFILLFSFTFWSCQNIRTSPKDEKLVESIKLLDSYLQNNDDHIADILCSDVSFGHSNGWVQNLEDFKKDFSSRKVVYKQIRQLEISEIKRYKNIASVRRTKRFLGVIKTRILN
ncbi:hypothetical protein CHRYSEOSP005_00720 [Chryseobacterium sp. Alg-005]|uniref:hypothetical protein n=1 Tax=Chryseobacterium sp. Alg-005 TaxID=3159516 RepID=UPI00355573C2